MMSAAAEFDGGHDAGRSEADVREELAACYRIFDMLGWVELIFNHITVKLPGPEEHFLINPYGLMYAEVTASNLVKIDIDGNIVGKSDWPVNKTGYIIHGAVHRARPDVHCVMHTHTTSAQAVACLEEGLTQTNFYSAFLHGKVTYHDFEGVTTRDDECPRLVENLGEKYLMILRSHGLLACGASIPDAFYRLWTLQRACDVQVAAASAASVTAGGVLAVPEAAARHSTEALDDETNESVHVQDQIFAALRRRLDARDQDYKL